MSASERGLPSVLLHGRRRFEAWRERRPAGSRIPTSLWALAVRLAQAHGISRTAGALGLDYYGLKQRAEAAAGPAQSSGPAFIELPSPVPLGKQCLLELGSGSGPTLRIQLVGYDAVEVGTLARGLWNAE
jgi:hypothetical protein